MAHRINQITASAPISASVNTPAMIFTRVARLEISTRPCDRSGGPGSVWSQPAGQVHGDKCEAGADCIEFAYFDDKLDFIPVDSSYRY
jgi:hypothetical protein